VFEEILQPTTKGVGSGGRSKTVERRHGAAVREAACVTDLFHGVEKAVSLLEIALRLDHDAYGRRKGNREITASKQRRIIQRIDDEHIELARCFLQFAI
jgi:hypothetical protein